MKNRFAVLVIGGGPAGACVSHVLARVGLSVAVLERSWFEHKHAGESFPPEIFKPLMQLDVWDRFCRDEYVRSPGIVSAWGSDQTHELDFISNPYGAGWHVDRRQFDAMMARAAEDAGATWYEKTRVLGVERAATGGWEVRAVLAGSEIRLFGKLLVDATGRSANVARRLGATQVGVDHLVAMFAVLQREVANEEADERLLIESVEDGWWYSAPLPSRRIVAVFMTDADYVPSGRQNVSALWQSNLNRAPHTIARLRSASHSFNVHVVGAQTCSLAPCIGDGWVALGDAAAAIDPLSGHGVLLALQSGLKAADAIRLYLDGDRSALESYANWVTSTYRENLQRRTEYYGAETRWPNCPFWHRRKEPVVPENVIRAETAV